MKRLLLALCLIGGPVQAQQAPDTVYMYTLPPNAAAVTECLGGRVRTMIDIRILKLSLDADGHLEMAANDSTIEILVHELAHQKLFLEAGRNCVLPDSVLSIDKQELMQEVYAYCQSLPYAVMRGWDRNVRRADYIHKVYRQFGGKWTIRQVVELFDEVCPSS